jgi:hypothetical protein
MLDEQIPGSQGSDAEQPSHVAPNKRRAYRWLNWAARSGAGGLKHRRREVFWLSAMPRVPQNVRSESCIQTCRRLCGVSPGSEGLAAGRKQRRACRGKTLRFADPGSVAVAVFLEVLLAAFCFCAQPASKVHGTRSTVLGRVTFFLTCVASLLLLFFFFFSTMTSPSSKALDPAASPPVEASATAAHPPAHKPDPTLASNASQRR